MFLKVSRSPLHGQGCFTTRAIAAGDIVARVRVLVFPPEETELLSKTSLKNYMFYVRDGATETGPYYTALAMGPVSFCNHDPDPNCSFLVDEAAGEIVLTADRDLPEDEEVTISYGDYADEIL